jgi:hypothetical protein
MLDKYSLNTYQDTRSLMRIWDEDITPNEVYLAEKAFDTGSYEDAQRWGNHLLLILKHKAGMIHQYRPGGSSEAVDL